MCNKPAKKRELRGGVAPSFSVNKEKATHLLFFLAALTAILCVGLICVFLFSVGIPTIARIGAGNFLLGRGWTPSDIPPEFGIFPMIVGSLYVTLGAVLFGAPIGIFTAVFMAKICPPKLYKVLKPAVELLAGIPSVVYGFFGIVLLVPLVREFFGGNGNSILTASVLLGIMILPTIIGVCEHSLRCVPQELYDGAVALGASRERALFGVVLPAARSGMVAAVVLGIGRAIGETMAVKMVAGNQPLLRMPTEFLKGVRTLTANVVIEMGYAEGLHRDALVATGVVLFIFILLINSLFAYLNRGTENE